MITTDHPLYAPEFQRQTAIGAMRNVSHTERRNFHDFPRIDRAQHYSERRLIGYARNSN